MTSLVCQIKLDLKYLTEIENGVRKKGLEPRQLNLFSS